MKKRNTETKTVNGQTFRIDKQTNLIFKLNGRGIWDQLDAKELFKLI